MLIIEAFDVKDQLEKRPKFHTRLRRCRNPIRPGKESKGSKALRAAVAVGYSPMGVLADASEITGLPRDNFDVWEIM